MYAEYHLEWEFYTFLDREERGRRKILQCGRYKRESRRAVIIVGQCNLPIVVTFHYLKFWSVFAV
jgi:hypothetical protein